MCCFSGPVVHVTGTRIFARCTGHGTQMLAYAMHVSAKDDVAMVLPLPVPPRSPETAVRFVSLEAYPELFDDLQRAFPELPSFGVSGGFAPQALRSVPKLVVHQVGAYEASFVPTLADFDRLDRRFRLAPEVWDALPEYADHGFAVFKLKGFSRGLRNLFQRQPEPREFHPMAFEFPMRDPEAIFFPTVHVHDGAVHPDATFGHELYAQAPFALDETWRRSDGPTSLYVSPARAVGLVDGDAPVYRRSLYGTLPNRDVWVRRRRA